MTKQLDALLCEVNQDTLANLSVAVAAGVLTAVAARKLYKKYKENKILQKYGTQEKNEHLNFRNDMRDGASAVIDTHTAQELIDAKRSG